MCSVAPGQWSSLPLASSSAATLQSIRSDCQNQAHTGAIPNSPLNSEGWGDESYSSCLDPRALNLINCRLRGQKLEAWEQWITLFSAPWSNTMVKSTWSPWPWRYLSMVKSSDLYGSFFTSCTDRRLVTMLNEELTTWISMSYIIQVRSDGQSHPSGLKSARWFGMWGSVKGALRPLHTLASPIRLLFHARKAGADRIGQILTQMKWD